MIKKSTYLSAFAEKSFLSLFLFLLVSTILNSQNEAKNCFESTDYYDQEQQEALEIFTQNYIADYPQNAHSRGKITIPVVVHIVTQGMETGITDEQVYSQITALNRDFNRQNKDLNIVHPDFQDRIATVGFNFCLATLDPDGHPTTGITRTQTFIDNIATPTNSWLYHTDRGGQDAWDSNKYLNIWVTQVTLGIAGFATNPGQKSPEEDGVVINPRFFGMCGLATPPFHLGRIGVHEVGHYFNLKHPFNNGCDGNDFVEDVPQQSNFYNDCPIGENISCGTRDITTNFMNYTDDACQAMFTKGQAMRMQATLFGARSGLLNGNSCEPYFPTVSGAEIKIYPNPASYYFCVEVGNVPLEEIPYFIFNAQGAKVEEGIVQPNSRQHFPTYRNGVYFIQFMDGSKEGTVKKIVINN